MTHHDDDSRITDWLADGEGHGRGVAVDAALAKARSTNQRAAWLVTLTGGSFAEPRGTVLLRRGIVILGVVLLVGGLLAGGLAAGRMLPLHVPPQPVASAAIVAPSATAIPSVGPSAAAPSTGLVAYSVVDCPATGVPGGCPSYRQVTHAWLATADGRDAQPLPATTVVGWSSDGSRLVLGNTDDHGVVSLLLADRMGAVVATIGVPCLGPSTDGKDEGVGGHVCEDQSDFALSPDGTRVVYPHIDPNVENSSVLAVLDLATGQSTLLAATRTTNPPAVNVCNTSTAHRTCEGFDGNPRWSPDGRIIAFERQQMAPESGASWDSAALFVVDADGSNLRRVTPSSVHAIGPSWSPDGTRLAFEGYEAVLNAAGTSVLDFKYDVYRIGVDGAGLAQLTHDGISALPDWTSGGRLAFIRNAAPTGSEHWIMDAGGGNQGRLGDSLTDLTAVGCTTCIYVGHEPINGSLPRAYWQPVP